MSITSTPDFAVSGTVLTDLGANENILAITAQHDGKFLVAGWTTNYGGTAFVEKPYTLPLLARYDSDGSLDVTFGTSGVITPTTDALGFQYAGGVSVQDDGKIILSSSVGEISYLLRVHADGGIDTTFGNSGLVM